MGLLPAGTTWLDLVTFGIAIAGFGLALWRYRGETKVGVRVEVGVVEGLVVLVMTNIERRVITIERAGLTTQRNANGKIFERWHDVNIRKTGSSYGLLTSDGALPETLEAGSAPYGVRAGLRSVKSAFHPDVPTWAFCVDTYRNTYWGEVPEDVQAEVRATKRRIKGPEDDWGNPTAIEVEDDAVVEPSALYD